MAGKRDKRRRAHGSNGRRRANSTGTLERRGGVWLARWYVRTPQGDRVRMSQTLEAKTRTEAEAELRRLTEGNALITREKVIRKRLDELDAVRAELRRVEDAQPALAIADAFAAFEDSPERPQKCGAATMRQYEMQYGRFVAWMAAHFPEAREVRQVTKAEATAFLADLGRRASPNTYNKYVALLRVVWRTLGEAARCSSNPWENVRRKVQPKSNGRRALTVEELRRVCLPLAGEMRVLFALGIYTGLRLGDCALMDWGAVDMARRVIVATPRKTARTGCTVEVPIHPALFAILEETPAELRMGRLMPDMAATYERDTSAVAARVRRAFEAAGFSTRAEVDGYSNRVVKVGFHSLRHSFVSLMGNAGAPLALVQAIVGHANPMMTAHYFHARTDALANAVATLPDVAQPPQIAPVEPLQIAEIQTASGWREGGRAATFAPEAATGHAEREDAAKGTERRAGARTRLEAFYAAFAALSPEERNAARRWVALNDARKLWNKRIY